MCIVDGTERVKILVPFSLHHNLRLPELFPPALFYIFSLSPSLSLSLFIFNIYIYKHHFHPFSQMPFPFIPLRLYLSCFLALGGHRVTMCATGA